MSDVPGCDRVLVVIPARNEAEGIAACLHAVRRAADHALAERPWLDIGVTVVLDSCTDGTAEVLAGFPWVDRLDVELAVVGAVRRAGVREAVDRASADPARTWVLCTDADSEVHPAWISRHLQHSDRGTEVVAGRVEPDPEGLDTDLLRRWWHRHHPDGRTLHVHGANLGFRLDRYDLVGGFAPLSTGEDVDLVARMRASGAACSAETQAPTRTSARLTGRAPAGFAAYLVTLGAR